MIRVLSRAMIAMSLVFFSTVAIISVVPNTAQAAGDPRCHNSFLGIPQWYKYVPMKYDSSTESCAINKDAAKLKNNEGRLVILILLGVFDIVIFIAGFAAVAFIIYGGFQFLTSTGEPQKISAARTTIFNALVGLAVAILASRVVAFIGGRFF